MSESLNNTPATDAICARFLSEVQAGGEPSSVLAQYCEDHPELRSEFRELLATRKILAVIREEATAGENELKGQIGDFKILRRIASGGMGEIYEARQGPFQRRVALKVIRGPHRRRDPRVQARFQREQDILARLHHSHIVPIHAAGTEGDIQYFAMPFIEGAPVNMILEGLRPHGPHLKGSQTPTLAEMASKLAVSSGFASDQGLSTVTLPGHDSNPDIDMSEFHLVASEGPLLRLSHRYFQSVARVVAHAADAIDHAHQSQVVHRDLKPSNLMVDRDEHCWIIDFGLAVAPGLEAQPIAEAGGDNRAASPVTRFAGSIPYMAPEQLEGEIVPSIDVWGLGTILYELLTLRQAFENRHEIRKKPPARPRSFVSNIPLDLEDICLKALEKSPARRYASAAALADDLRRWLRREPTLARPACPPRRAWLWSCRNPAWAFLLTALIVGGFVLAGFSNEIRRVEIAHAVVRNQALEEENQAREREIRTQQIQFGLLSDRRTGWSRDLWDMVRESAAIRSDPQLQALAVESLSGLDAREVVSLPMPGRALAFDPAGDHLWIDVGRQIVRDFDPAIRVWDRSTNRDRRVDLPGECQFAFPDHGTTRALVTPQAESTHLELWNVEPPRRIARYELAEGMMRFGLVHILPNGSLIAALAEDDVGRQVVQLWSSDGEASHFVLPESQTRSLRLMPDASHLATGHADGAIRLWSLPEGRLEATLSAGHTPPLCLDFAPDPLVRLDGTPPGYLLAAGDAGGVVTIWDLSRKVPRSSTIVKGPEPEDLAFSPNGMHLAVCGRYAVALFDVATGRHLLSLPAGNYIHDVDFSADGRYLAAACEAAFDSPAQVVIFEMEPGRGAESWQGLSNAINRVAWTPDHRFLAALASNWQVAVWDRPANRLLRVFEVQPGDFVDNASLALSPDGRQLACSGGLQARLWSIESGRTLHQWDLPVGLAEAIAFREPGQLLLTRTETLAMQVPPYTEYPAEAHPRVVRIRDLLGADPYTPLATITDFNLYVNDNEMSPDASYLATEGIYGTPDAKQRSVSLYRVADGQRIWTEASEFEPSNVNAYLRFDPTSTVLLYASGWEPADKPRRTLQLQTLGSAGRLPVGANYPGPRIERWMGFSTLPGIRASYLTLHERQPDRTILHLVGTRLSGTLQGFTADGDSFIYGQYDGQVIALHLDQLKTRLTEVGLGW